MYQTIKVFIYPHDVCIDDDENMYVAQWNSRHSLSIQTDQGMRKSLLLLFFSVVSMLAFSQDFQLSKPVIQIDDNGFFQKLTKVFIDFRLDDTVIRYTLDGREPDEHSPIFKKLIRVKKTSLLKVKAFKRGFISSETVKYNLVKVDDSIPSLTISPEAKTPYAGAGATTLINRKAGSLNFRDGNWLGYNQGPITIDIDLQKLKSIEFLTLSTLNSPASWIMPPESLTLLVSSNGQDYQKEPDLEVNFLSGISSSEKAYYRFDLEKRKVRYLRLVVNPLSTLPNWHPGKGNPGWGFYGRDNY